MVTTSDKPTATPAAPPAAKQGEPLINPFDPLVLRLPNEWRFSDSAFAQLWELNEPLQFEYLAEGALIITLPPTGRGPWIGTWISHRVWFWIRAGGGGIVLDASGGYSMLPLAGEQARKGDRDVRMPDVSWFSQEQRDAMTDEQIDRGLPDFCPPFVVEIISPSQTVASQQRKMREWLAYGAQLGWLIDLLNPTVWVYRAGQSEHEELRQPATLSGEDVLSGFTLDCAPVWSRR